MPDVDIAGLYQSLGALQAPSEERAKQTKRLFDLVNDMNKQMPTREDIRALTRSLERHIEDARVAVEDIHKRVGVLEADRALMKGAVAVAIGAPPFLAGAIEVCKWVFGKHL